MTTTVRWSGLFITMLGVSCASLSGRGTRVGGTAGLAAHDACFGVADAEQRSNLFEGRPILGVREVREPLPPKGHLSRRAGAEIYLLGSPSSSREWLGHLLECRVARNAVAQNAVTQPARPDPLAVRSAVVDVASTSNGFVVTITSPDVDDADRIYRESQELMAASPRASDPSATRATEL